MDDSNNEYIKMEKQIEKIFDNATSSKNVHEAVLFVENSKGDFSVNCGYGGKDINSPLFMASISKLFVTSCILILQEKKMLSLDDYLVDYFNKDDLKGLHIYKANEYSYDLKISDLLFQTSGLPHWVDESDIIEQILKEDFEITFEELLEKTKKLKPHFSPNTKKKAFYGEMNFNLLIKIIENVTGSPLAEVYQEYIFTPLGLTNTYLPTKTDDFIPHIYYKNESLYRPKFLSSISDTITTAEDLMLFLKGFWGGSLFPQSIFEKLSTYKKLQMSMGPIFYGGGYMQIPMKSIYTLFMGKGELLGHSGSTGSFAFYFPEKDLYFVGDFNQMANSGLPIKLVIKLAMKLK